MATPRLAPCLVQLRAEFNACNPNRDKSSDGWIGDTAHQSSKSDHNPDKRGVVHAIDVDETGPWDGESFSTKIERLRLRCKSGAEKRITYIIYEGHICSAIDNWRWRDYSGANPHDKHAHVSCSYTLSHENSTATFGVRKPAPPPEETGVSKQDVLDAFDDPAGRAKLQDIIRWTVFDWPANSMSFNNLGWLLNNRSAYIGESVTAMMTALSALQAASAALRAAVDADEASDVVDRESLLAALAAAEARLTAVIEARPDDNPLPEPEPES